ncbi:MAG: hydrogen gas-evolving membrane-bound hydrogenase subunit E, partial [Vreelandella alkaliphila]
NVILVDYRALDTLGEMFVLALAAIGVIAMLKLRHDTDESKAADSEKASVKEPYDG